MWGMAKQDIRTVTGSNLALLRRETGLDPVLASIGKFKEQLLKGVCSAVCLT